MKDLTPMLPQCFRTVYFSKVTKLSTIPIAPISFLLTFAGLMAITLVYELGGVKMIDMKKSALLMLHWQNSVANPKGVWGKNLYPQVVKNNSIENAKKVLKAAREKGMLIIYVNIGWRPGFPEVPANQYYPLIQGAKDENKGIIGSWDVDVIDELKPAKNEKIVINFGSDSFESTDLNTILRAHGVEHIYVSGQCIEHVVATTVKRAVNMGYNATIMKDCTSGFTDSNYACMLDVIPLYAKVITSDEFIRSL